MSRLVLAFCLLVLWFSPLAAEEPHTLKGVALVVGQSKYQHIAALPNPANDARDIEKLLEDLGFEVTGVADRDARKLRRDLERFAEDAEGADVAIVYYSGHGIEAGGENWLVPVDANLESLAEAGTSLVPLSGVLDGLKATVPITIVLLDACRSDPFPPGAVVKRGGDSLAISPGGLGVPRGFAQVPSASSQSLGVVIGYAAEPGQPALDGEAGANSPYAAAILRHLSALPGTEFGLVMRMVTEEVYLKTRAQQRPWLNESLRRQLYFGAAPAAGEGEEAMITGERRKLLLTIADLPDPQRRQIERIATADGVSLDTLYGVLRALGQTDLPQDPESLDRLLRAQAARLKTMADENRGLAVDDPAIAELMAAADRAMSEGAIATARDFFARAKEAVESSRGAIETAEARANAKRIANAAVLVKSAEAAELDFDHAAAAGDYAAAFDWVKDADLALAARYKTYEADAFQAIGSLRGEAQAFDKAIAAYGQARALIGRDIDARQWAKATNNLANVHLRLGERNLDAAPLETAIGLYREALSVEAADSPERATTLSNLGIALNTLAERRNDGRLFTEAEAAFAEAIASHDRTKNPKSRAIDLLNAANLDVALADRNGEPQRLDSAVRKIEEALQAIDPVTDRIEWAQAKNNLAIAWRIQGTNAGDVARVRQSLATYEEVLLVFDRKSFPLDWGNTNGNIAIAHTTIGAMEANLPEFEKALDYYRPAFEEVTRERAPVFWAKLNNSFGMTLQVIGQMKSDPQLMEQAADAFRKSLSVRRKEINAEQWADSQQRLASALSSMASARADVKLADEAIAAYKSARQVFSREAFPADYLSVSSGLAMALQGKGILTQDVSVLREAEAIYREVLAATDRNKAPRDWASATKDVATIQFMLGTTLMDKAMVEESIRNFDRALDEFKRSGSFMDRMMIGAMRDNAAKALDLFK